MSGTVYGVGLGPGAQDLLSVRADRLVRGGRHVAYFRKAGRPGQARRIAQGMLRDDAIELAMEYPVTTEIPLTDPRYNDCLAAFYADCTGRLLAIAEAGEDVVVLCEGDPFFYGSFMHLHSRLSGLVPVEVVPGIMGMSGAWNATGLPITWGDDVLTVAMATLPEEELVRRIRDTDALVVMKIMLLPDLHTDFSRGGSGGLVFPRGGSGGLVFPSLEEFSTVYCDPHSQRLWHSQ